VTEVKSGYLNRVKKSKLKDFAFIVHILDSCIIINTMNFGFWLLQFMQVGLLKPAEMTTDNALYGKPTNWVGDGSSDGGTIQVDGTVITMASAASSGSPFTVFDDVNLLDDKNKNVAYYFEGTIEQLDGSFSLGVIAKDEVAAGYKARGMFYNGNLINGSAALRTNFGKYIMAGDKVGILYDATATTGTKLYYYVNNQCLGLGFDIPASNSKQQYLPCLHVTGTAKINFSVPETLPTKRDREAAPPSGNEDPYRGEWKLNTAFYGPELGPFPLPDNHNIIASFEKASSVLYRFGIKVGNSMGTNITLTGKTFEGGFDEVTIGTIQSTMMMPPPELQPVEFELIGKGLPVVNKMIVTTSTAAGESDGQKTTTLLMQGPIIELELVPYVATFKPLTSYQ
jgi:hypothetical protein